MKRDKYKELAHDAIWALILLAVVIGGMLILGR